MLGASMISRMSNRSETGSSQLPIVLFAGIRLVREVSSELYTENLRRCLITFRHRSAKAAPALILTLQHKPTMRGVPARHRDFGTGVREFVLETGYFSSRWAVGRVIAMCFQVCKSQPFPFAILSDRTIFADSGIPVLPPLATRPTDFSTAPTTNFSSSVGRRSISCLRRTPPAALCAGLYSWVTGPETTLCTLNLEPAIVLWLLPSSLPQVYLE